MAKFKVIKVTIKGKEDKFIPEFESEVQSALNEGWTIINCERHPHALYAFVKKD